MGLTDEQRRFIAETSQEIEREEAERELLAEFPESDLERHSKMLVLAHPELDADTARGAVEEMWQDPARRAAFREKAAVYAEQRSRQKGLQDKWSPTAVLHSAVEEHGEVTEEFLLRKMDEAMVEAGVKDEYVKSELEAEIGALLESARDYAVILERQEKE